MFADRLRTTALLAIGAGCGRGGDAQHQHARPADPDRAPFKDRRDDGLLYLFWTFDENHQHGFLLNPGEDEDVAAYAAGFRLSPDSQWLVRMQKLGAGYHTLYLYRRNGLKFSPAAEFAENNAEAVKVPGAK